MPIAIDRTHAVLIIGYLKLGLILLLTFGCGKTGKDYSSGQDQGSQSPPDNGTIATIVLSTTPNGATATTFRLTDTIYGRVLKSGPGALACVETFGVSDGFCSVASNFTPMPNADWSFDSLTNEWKATLRASVFGEGTYKFFWRNKGSSKAAFLAVQILPQDKPLMVAVEYPYNRPETTFLQFEAIYLQVAQAPKVGSAGCVETVGTSDGFCGTATNWTDMPANGWTYSNSLQRWESLIKSGEFPPNTYRLFWKNKTTGAVSDPMLVTIAPDTGPILVYAKTPYGPAETTFKTTDRIYGYVINGDSRSAKACAETKGTGACTPPEAWATMPANGWTFSDTNQRWESVIEPGTIGVAEYVSWWKNVITNTTSAAVNAKVVAP